MTISTLQVNDRQRLNELANKFRCTVLDITTHAGSGHPSSSFSSVEILTVLYFGGVLRYRADEPDWPNRDRFILSKGHAAPLFYTVLAEAGYFDKQLLGTLRTIGSPVEGHPVQGKLPGIENTSGSLGKGISVGIGHALGARMNDLGYRVYVLLGDGECEEGQIWEGAMAAAHFKNDNLVAIVDYNKYQETGPISREMALEPFADKWRSFGWYAIEADGHDVDELSQAFRDAGNVKGKPSVIIAHTVKGKGVSFVEADFTYHGRALTEDEAVGAREELECR
ncbi:MAG: transketolase [Chloroflexota bacterium]|nr:transketolase [Chloroflexota bacterium]